MATFVSARSVLAVRDLKLATRFFVEVLGFAPDLDGPPGWSFLAKDAFRVMLGECPDEMLAEATGNHSWFVHLIIEGLDDYHADVRRKGAHVLSGPTDRPWGLREFVIRTPDGHRMVFGERLVPPVAERLGLATS
jgi:catechol 2,3-dioxygenase-like lactoylglutathione lyase family enzyme